MRRYSVAAGVLVLLVVAAVVYGRYGFDIARWGCPSTAELQRPRSADEVVDAFERDGIALEPIPLPDTLPRRSDPVFRGARAYRHSGPGATAHVLVLRSSLGTRVLPERPRAGRGERFTIAHYPGNNVVAWITETERGEGVKLYRAIGPPVNQGAVIDSDGRCYIR